MEKLVKSKKAEEEVEENSYGWVGKLKCWEKTIVIPKRLSTTEYSWCNWRSWTSGCPWEPGKMLLSVITVKHFSCSTKKAYSYSSAHINRVFGYFCNTKNKIQDFCYSFAILEEISTAIFLDPSTWNTLLAQLQFGLLEICQRR